MSLDCCPASRPRCNRRQQIELVRDLDLVGERICDGSLCVPSRSVVEDFDARERALFFQDRSARFPLSLMRSSLDFMCLKPFRLPRSRASHRDEFSIALFFMVKVKGARQPAPAGRGEAGVKSLPCCDEPAGAMIPF